MSDQPLQRYADLLVRFPAIHDNLRGTPDVAEMLARGTRLACEETGFTRGIVVGIRDGLLTADALGVMPDRGSDQLRRRLLEHPQRLLPGSLESELIRRADRYATSLPSLPSTLAAALDLADPAFGIIAPESATVGLLVLDAPPAAVDEADRSVVTLFARLLSVVLEHVVMRARIAELSAELRHLTVSAQALATEAFEGEITLPVHGRYLPSLGGVQPGDAAGEDARHALTEREVEIARLLAAGRSNREIATQLFLAPDTVKSNVARIIRKLGAANRVEAAIAFLGLAPTQPPV